MFLVCIPPQESVNLIAYSPGIKPVKAPVVFEVPMPIGDGATME
jgi:hypothetical protein